ncbi:embryonic stem cell-related gene protein-like [Hylobates moloch]|uniref:embryonic stem cell-related gene protein-like n=1 Tax=Hylobates moloch TaxID=81572 RepID=UPI002675D0E9|nr:embryonic stem cell-related gene protein-like [Hylobates moloch]
MYDTSEIWCRDSDRGTSLRRSIPCPPVLCSVRKIHLRPQVLRLTSPRNISLISNPVFCEQLYEPKMESRAGLKTDWSIKSQLL